MSTGVAFGPLVRLLLAVYDCDYDQPMPRAAQLLRCAESHGLVERGPSTAGTRREPIRERKHPVRLTPKGIAYLYATGAIEPSLAKSDQHLGYLQAAVVVQPEPA